MAGYFSLFPKIFYEQELLTDIAVNIRIRSTWLTNPKIYYNYSYQDHDKPEHIALKYYGKETYHWIILLTNNIFDVNFDFPMSQPIFNAYIKDKYKEKGEEIERNGLEYALITPDPVYRYQKTIKIYDANSSVNERHYVISEHEYETFIPKTKSFVDSEGNFLTYESQLRFPVVTIYDKENERNEEKRLIKILKKEFVEQARSELSLLLK